MRKKKFNNLFLIFVLFLMVIGIQLVNKFTNRTNNGNAPESDFDLGTSGLFDGFYVSHTWSISSLGGGSSNMSYIHVSGDTFHCTWTHFLGASEWDVNSQTREISNPTGTFTYTAGTHDPGWIFTNVTTGSIVPIALLMEPDHDFNVTGTAVYNYSGHGPVEVWILNDLTAPGGVLCYSTASGVLMNGSVSWLSMYTITYQFTSTNAYLTNDFSPSLTSSSVFPSTGTIQTLFNYSVTYEDADNNTPIDIDVLINGTRYPMEKVNDSDVDFTDGCEYQYLTYLSPGNYTFSFNCSDGKFSNSTGTGFGPNVTGGNVEAPTLSSGGVNPPTGYNSTMTFTFSVNYSDPDNNAPESINVTINGSVYGMTRQNPLDSNYMDGCIFVYNTVLNDVGLYSYHFNASDGNFTASDGPYEDLVIEEFVPIFFDGMTCNYSYYYDWVGTSLNMTDTVTDNGGYSYTIVESGGYNRDVDGLTRQITNDYGMPAFTVGSHEPICIFPNVSLGSSNIPISVFSSGDQVFSVTGEVLKTIFNQTVICWELESPEGSIACYEKKSGLLIDGRFIIPLLGYYYTVNITGTNVPFGANDHGPELTGGSFSPLSGNQTTLFNFSVTYSDQDDNPPYYINAVINGTAFPMEMVNPSNPNFTGGCLYQLVTPLQPGTYEYFFECSDGLWTNATGSSAGPTVSSLNDNPPVLSDATVKPWKGFNDTTTFIFSVCYTDLDNNAPVSINVSINGTSHSMSQLDPLDINYMDGCIFTCETSLSLGTYEHSFDCFDGMTATSLGPFTGPLSVEPPYFDGMFANYNFTSSFLSEGTWNLTYSHLHDLTYHVASNSTPQGNDTWDVDFSTRVIENSTDMLMASGMHTPFWINPGVTIGDVVDVGTYMGEDASYNVTMELIHDLTGFGPIEVWVLEDLASDGIAWYEKSTGLLLNGTFYYMAMIDSSYDLLDTNINFSLCGMYFMEGGVSPMNGSSSMSYNFSVLYFNTDNIAPATIEVVIDSIAYSMIPSNPSDTNYVDGAWYEHVNNSMDVGNHSFYFNASDGSISNRYPSTGEIDGPYVMPYEFSALHDGKVDPNASDEHDNYRFSVIYQDTQNSTPSWIYLNLDGMQYAMVKDPADDDFTNGVEYSYENSSMALISHEYYFEANNGTTTIRYPAVGDIPGPRIVLRNYNSVYTENSPVIDGNFIFAEWNDAFMQSGELLMENLTITSTGYPLNYTIWIKNNATHLFICLVIENETYTENAGLGIGDMFMVYFDDNLNGVLDVNEQGWCIDINPFGTYYSSHDAYFEGSYFELDTASGSTEDGTSAFSHTSMVEGQLGNYTFEIAMPFNSTDPRDLQLVNSSQVGFKIAFIDYEAFVAGAIPFFTDIMEIEDPHSYGVLTLAGPYFPPISIHPSDMILPENSTNINITWQLFTRYDVGDYRVLRDGVVIQPWQAWPGNASNITVPVDTNSGLGDWNYTIEFYDNTSWGVPDIVWVTVNDLPRATGGGTLNNTAIPRNATNYHIDWVILDECGSAGEYRVLINGALYIDWTTWSNGSEIQVPVDTNRGFGDFNYTLQYHDIYSFYGIDSRVNISIYDAPVSNYPQDMIALENSTGDSIDWKLVDSVGPSEYRVLLNGNLHVDWTVWLNDSFINISIMTNSGIGYWNYTIQFNNSRGYRGLDDTVMVLIDDAPRIVQKPASTMLVPQNGTGYTLDWRIEDGIGAGNYTILVNGTPLPGHVNASWPNNTIFSIPIDTNGGLGLWIYELIYRDSNGFAGVPDSINITVDDLPGISNDMNLSYVMLDALPVNLSWSLSDSSGNGSYSVILDGTTFLATNLSWFNNTPFLVVFNASQPGYKNITLLFSDANGFTNSSAYSILVDVPPIISSSPSLTTVNQGQSGLSLVWTILDNGDGNGSYVLYRNGVMVDSGSWVSDAEIAIPLDTDLSLGEYNFTLEFWDSFNNTGTPSSIMISVTKRPNPVMDFFEDYWYLFLAIGIGALIGIIAISKVRKKKVQKAKSGTKKSKIIDEIEKKNLPENGKKREALRWQPEQKKKERSPAQESSYFCTTCNKSRVVQDPVPSIEYKCPDCNQVLARLSNCPHCNHSLVLSADFYTQYKSKSVSCPHCQYVFTLE